MDWKEIPKIDGHVHVLPEKQVQCYREEEPGVWDHAGVGEYLAVMEEFHVEKAVIVPINEPYLYEHDPDATNAWLASVAAEHLDRFLPFCDVVNNGGYFHEFAPQWLDSAVSMGLRGLKLHPTNLGIPADSLDLVPVLRRAAAHKVPVMVHSYPQGSWARYDLSEPARIHEMAKVFPDVTFIISHLGGHRWPDAIGGREYVDLSTFLPELVELYGLAQANRILRRFGPQRLIFATDYPQVRGCKPEKIYSRYCALLNQMDFTLAEAEQIAYGNMAEILGL